ncbi:MAG: hypothetical protein AB7L66_14910 [Gemmatimonadales bacterium]
MGLGQLLRRASLGDAAPSAAAPVAAEGDGVGDRRSPPPAGWYDAGCLMNGPVVPRVTE